jgi:serine/threonine-protein kinase HipA
VSGFRCGARKRLFFDGGNYYIPEGASPSSHILKTAMAQLDNTVINETFCMTLAFRVGLPVPAAQVVTIGGKHVFMVERYDRTRSAAGNVVRLHPEDFCQALGIPPELKYEKEGGPGFGDCFRLVEEWSDEPLLAAGNLLNWAIFNFIIGNADAHGKNVSFLYNEGLVRVAPFMTSSAPRLQVPGQHVRHEDGNSATRYVLRYPWQICG